VTVQQIIKQAKKIIKKNEKLPDDLIIKILNESLGECYKNERFKEILAKELAKRFEMKQV
jgi:adenylate kinase family enzyme